MTVARQLADFLTSTAASDLPPPALDHAAMLIASTIASAAAGKQIDLGAHHSRAGARASADAKTRRSGSTTARVCRPPMLRRPTRS